MNKIYNLLFEQDTENIDTPESSMSASSTDVKARKALDSVDDQIDALILKYESASIREEPVDKLSESLFNKNLKYLIEQDEPAGDPMMDSPTGDAGGGGEGAEASEDAEAPDPSGSEKMDVNEPGEPLVPDLDVDAFASRTVRLISNYKSLLRLEEAIINRIKNFLDENYGDKFVQRYMEILEEQYGITLEEFEDTRQTKDEEFAVGAFAGGTGGLGGGG